MNEHPTFPSPATVTIGGKAYAATHPRPAAWYAFESCSPNSDPLGQVLAAATLLKDLCGDAAKDEIADRMAAGELVASDIIDAVRTAADQWRTYMATGEPLTADERDVLRLYAATASGRVWAEDIVEALNPWPWDEREGVGELVSVRWDARNNRLVETLWRLERRGYLTPAAGARDETSQNLKSYREITAAGRAVLRERL